MNKLFYLFALIFLYLTSACESDIDSQDLTISKNDLTGEWIVKAYFDQNEIFGPFTIVTQNTPNEDSIVIKDNSFWGFETKAASNISNGLFETKLSTNEISSVEAKVKIEEGKVINQDSICFNIQFEDDKTPYGFTYQIKGHRSR